MTTIDLDARREERLATASAREVKFSGKVYPVHPELPMEVLDHLAEGNYREACEALFVEPADYAAMLADGASLDDIMALVDGFTESLGGLGKRSASRGSSGKTAQKPRQTSKKTTA